eukprot:CAMPEP_0167767930 /NCGR_PEP_ID=MMETSP0110_2-20121227/16347_1 /TAXON_ID=629695 /ORGANISM="Gymnochlora sp., Strain CCMP2014" /LENGTH=56 /DNA_ID=CAMNT_0007656471 /DNA_START=41 /DNA_END=211 /DNA_ORIENTATION=+
MTVVLESATVKVDVDIVRNEAMTFEAIEMANWRGGEAGERVPSQETPVAAKIATAA